MHVYASTYCYPHGLHDQCRLTCKICASPCTCPCHIEESYVQKSEIERRMSYHPIRGNQKFLYESNRDMYIRMAEFINALGDSREMSLALTALQESLMWVNAHIATNDIDVEDDRVEAS